MSSTLFAFRVARPIESASDGELEISYDPQSQTATWSGDAKAIAAVHCCRVQYRARKSCNAYGTYCTTTGSYVSKNGYICEG